MEKRTYTEANLHFSYGDLFKFLFNCPLHTYTDAHTVHFTLRYPGVVNRGHIETGLQWGFYPQFPFMMMRIPHTQPHTLLDSQLHV